MSLQFHHVWIDGVLYLIPYDPDEPDAPPVTGGEMLAAVVLAVGVVSLALAAGVGLVWWLAP